MRLSDHTEVTPVQGDSGELEAVRIETEWWQIRHAIHLEPEELDRLCAWWTVQRTPKGEGRGDG